MIQRASCFDYAPGCSLTTCSAEDLIILKAFANRAVDWIDVEGILIRQGNDLDYSYALNHLEPLCSLKESPEILDRLKQLITKRAG